MSSDVDTTGYDRFLPAVDGVANEDVPRWGLNHALDHLVQALETVDDLDALVAAFERASATHPEGDAPFALVLSALATTARAVSLIRKGTHHGNT